MKLKYIKRTTKTNRQELLNKALQEEMEQLRKDWVPRKRRPFLLSNVSIRETNTGKENFSGKYLENEEKHIIEINKQFIIWCQKHPIKHVRRRNYEKLRDIIRHELIHAFVRERYQPCTFIKNVNHDASPIFLLCLATMAGTSGHDCFKAFCTTELFEESMCIFDIEELDYIIFTMLQEYNNICKKLKNFGSTDTTKNVYKNNIAIENMFSFASRQAGLTKKIEGVHKIKCLTADKKILNLEMKVNSWEIGCNVQAENLEKLFLKKLDCKAELSNKVEDFRIFAENGDTIKTITLKEENIRLCA